MKHVDGMNADGAESMFILITLEKIKEMRLKFSHGSVTKIMTNYQEARVKLKNTQLIKVKIHLKKYDRNNIKNE